MTLAPPGPTTQPHHEYDPDVYRMTIGEHLEELRRRMILALLGMALVAGVCFCFGNKVLEVFCRPIVVAQRAENLNTQLHTTELDEGFFVWLEVNLITSAVLSAPWIIYQFWQFVATGLYPAERKYITKYMPLSVMLLIAGTALVYFAVLPWTCSFFLGFTTSVPTPVSDSITNESYSKVVLPHLKGDPPNPQNGEMWIDEQQGKVKLFLDGKMRSVTYNTDALLAPHISLSDYIDMVVGLVVTFALAFQTPLVVLAMVKIGLVPLSALIKARRYVYFGSSIVAAFLAPHDVVTAQVALMIPLCLLYELGIFLAKRSERAEQRAASVS